MEVIKALVDNSVFHHAVEHEGTWESTGKAMWGGAKGVPVETGRLISKENPKTIREQKGGSQGKCIAALQSALKSNRWEAHTSDALSFERLHQPAGRFFGVNYGDWSLLEGVNCENHSTLAGLIMGVPTQAEPILLLRHLLDALADEDYLEIRSALEAVGSKKSSQDAWHLVCVQRLKLNKFLTCDTRLIGQVKSIRDKKVRAHLLDIVTLPCELCDLLELNN